MIEGTPKSENKERKQEISKIHFLVHPGYIIENTQLGKLADKKFYELCDAYIEKARTLNEKELMVIFAPVPGHEFIKDLRAKNTEHEKKYIEVVKEVRGILKKRVIIFSNNLETYRPKAVEIVERIKKILEKRKLHLSEDFKAVSYGEYIDACVKAVSMNMHIALNMEKDANPVKIISDLTNFRVDGSEQRLENLRRYNNSPRIKIE